MAMIFPGMDPYLENRALWPGFHNMFMVYLVEDLQPRLGTRYVAAMEARVYIDEPGPGVQPDATIRKAALKPRRKPSSISAKADQPVVVRSEPVEVNESYVQILDLDSGKRVVTVIELLSPSNKRPGPGRRAYRHKQKEVLASHASLVEIDLLRKGRHTLAVPDPLAAEQRPYDVMICVSRASRRRRGEFELYPRRLRDPLPHVSLPLARPDRDIEVDLQAILIRAYESGAYDRRIQYDRPCRPPLPADDQAWADGLLRAAGKLADPPG